MNAPRAVLLLSLGLFGCSSGGDYSTPDLLLEGSAATVATLRSEHETFDYFLERSTGVLVFPGVVRAGLVFGVAGGNGVLVRRDGSGWGRPTFVKVGGVTFGAQAGAEKTQVAVILMNDRLINLLEKGLLDFGLASGISMGPASLDAAGTLQTVEDAYVYRDSSGAYAGLTLDGAVAGLADSLNSAYESGGGAEQARATDALRSALAGTGP